MLLLFGAFAGGVGWLVVVVLLWASPRWSDRDKLLGMLVLPGGLTTAFFLGFWVLGQQITSVACGRDVVYSTFTNESFADPCGGNDPLLIVLLVLAVAAPILTAVHLARRLGRRPRPASPGCASPASRGTCGRRGRSGSPARRGGPRAG